MDSPLAAADRGRAAMRVALSHYIANGISVALGLLLISGGVHLTMGTLAASAASVGVLVTAPPDLAAPRSTWPTRSSPTSRSTAATGCR